VLWGRQIAVKYLVTTVESQTDREWWIGEDEETIMACFEEFLRRKLWNCVSRKASCELPQSPGRDSSSGYPECEAEVVTTRPRHVGPEHIQLVAYTWVQL
jgi:hypothetical protein